MMKNILLLVTAMTIAVSSFAQTPEAFNYQAVARDASGDPIINANISVRIGILPGSESSTAVYSESFNMMTNEFGLFTAQVGNGNVIIGNFSDIDWTDGIYFLKVEIALDGSSFFLSGSSRLLSVPYALQAKSADNVFSGSYGDLTDVPNWNDSIAGAVFSGDYGDLDNLPDWADSIALYTEGAVVPEGVVEEGNMLIYDGSNWVAKDIIMEETGGGDPVSVMPPVQVVNFCIALQGVFPSRNIVEPFIGTIGLFGFDFAPRGWAKCDGQLLSIAQNTALFSLLGTYYGGDGRTTFGIPDLRGRLPMHQGQGNGLTNRVLGNTYGSETILIPVTALPAHNHVITFE